MDRIPRGVAFGIALLGPLALAALLATLRDVVTPASASLVLVLVVVAVSATGHRLAGVLAALSCTAWFDFFLTEPYYGFRIADGEEVEIAVLLTLVGAAVGELALWGRRQQSRASHREGYLDGVVSATKLAAAGAEPAAMVTFVADAITDLLGADQCSYRSGPGGVHPRIDADGRVTHDGRTLDVDRTGLPTSDQIEIPVERGGRVLGRFVVVATSRVVWPSVEARRVAVILAQTAGQVLVGQAPDRPQRPPGSDG